MRWKKEETADDARSLSVPDYLVSVLDVIDAEYLLLQPGEIVVKNSREIDSFGLMRDNKLNSEQILNLVRAARRSSKYQEATQNSHEVQLEQAHMTYWFVFHLLAATDWRLF